MRFLIISDIHCCSSAIGAHDAVSYVSNKTPHGSRSDPFSSIKNAIGGCPIDLLLCPGDITDKAEPDTLLYAWNSLRRLSEELECELIACSGNHDLDSRYKTGVDPAGLAMSLDPSLPVEDRFHFLEYWAEKFTILERGDAALLVLNTAAYHGAGEAQAEEIQHGRISDYTLERISSALAAKSGFGYGILLCHHHLAKNNEIRESDYSEAIGGQQLLTILERTGKPWLVVHGHKHRPRILYAQGGGSSPILIGAASFSANVRRDAQNQSPNQMHLVTLDFDGARNIDVELAGSIRSWNWIPNIGWIPSKGEMGLPHSIGFGARSNPAAIKKQLIELAKNRDGVVVKRSEIIEKIPTIAFLLPQDIEQVVRAVNDDGGVTIIRDEYGLIEQIGQRP